MKNAEMKACASQPALRSVPPIAVDPTDAGAVAAHVNWGKSVSTISVSTRASLTAKTRSAGIMDAAGHVANAPSDLSVKPGFAILIVRPTATAKSVGMTDAEASAVSAP